MVASSPHWVSPRGGKKKENKRSNYHKKDPSDFLAATSQSSSSSSSSSLSGSRGSGKNWIATSLLIEELTEYQNFDYKQKIMLHLHLWQRVCILYLYLYLFGKSSPCLVRLCSLIKDSAWLVNACYGHLTQSPWPSHHLLAQSPNYHQQGTFSVQDVRTKDIPFRLSSPNIFKRKICQKVYHG